MRIARRTSQFKQDVKRMMKQGKDFATFKTIIGELIQERILDARYHDHPLIGQYRGTRECHIEPDWLLVYESTPSEVILIRTGTHTDLFKS